jgi:DNA polymerase III psi subunit
MIEKKVAYEELNLLPIWLNKKSPKKTSHALYNIGLYFFKELNISIIVPELDNLTNDAKELFKNIHVYMNSISVNSKYLRNIEEGEIDVILKKNSIIHIFLIGGSSSMGLHDLDVTIKSLPSLDEMLSNPDKKKKLWHDIQSSLQGEMKGNN